MKGNNGLDCALARENGYEELSPYVSTRCLFLKLIGSRSEQMDLIHLFGDSRTSNHMVIPTLHTRSSRPFTTMLHPCIPITQPFNDFYPRDLLRSSHSVRQLRQWSGPPIQPSLQHTRGSHPRRLPRW